MSKHIKRLASPVTWKQPRKMFPWSVRSRAGPHPLMESVPLMVVVRDILKFADTSKEARNIISRGKVEVDGRVVKDYQRPVGFMDVLSVKEAGITKRVLMDRKGILVLADLPQQEAGWKLVKVTGKSMAKGGKIQISTHDGRVILTTEKGIRRGDTLKISIPDQKIQEIYPMAKETSVYVTGGAHRGTITTIKDINVSRSYQENTVESNDNFTTTMSNIFVLGKSKGEISIPGGA
ncbi:MAG: 30S ribosomal protein S4e [Candidatus Thermoplasmatota archaeon]|jgi:small subunit ribosomal protein S4e|nr:30S ribosomal protein S4e [Candidatus Thermoplasmatota archaeon]MCL5790233.1 30S ribosomal protein S4e [Candidatus Thermoplasmatota archaeon]